MKRPLRNHPGLGLHKLYPLAHMEPIRSIEVIYMTSCVVALGSTLTGKLTHAHAHVPIHTLNIR